MTSTFSIFDTLIKNSNKIINTGTINNNQILNKKPISSIPPTMKNSWRRIQKIPNLFVIDFGKGSLDGIMLLFLLCESPT